MGGTINLQRRLPACLIVDDGAPVNPSYFIHPERESTLLIPNSFTRDFAQMCAAHGVHGKFSVIPMPCAMGRIDQKLTYVSKQHSERFIRIVRDQISPRFDITPELLTHSAAIDLKSGRLLHLYEDEWIRNASQSEIEQYVVLALRILKNVGLDASGITSPWRTGINNEQVYSEAIGRAIYRVYRRKVSWYFLHVFRPEAARRPWVAWRSKEGLRVISVCGNTPDAFGLWTGARSRRSARRAIEQSADAILSRDGKRGFVRTLLERQMPITIVTHWQNLFSNGNSIGLRGLEAAITRINKMLDKDLEWMTCSKLARDSCP